MVIASKLIKFYKKQTLLKQEEESYDDKPLPPVPPHASTVVTFGGATTNEVPRTLRNQNEPGTVRPDAAEDEEEAKAAVPKGPDVADGDESAVAEEGIREQV